MRRVLSLSAIGLTSIILQHPAFAENLRVVGGIYPREPAPATAPVSSEGLGGGFVEFLLTGNGRAPKWQMQQAIQRELSLAAAPEPPDVADALAIALCHFHLSVRRVLAQNTATRSTARGANAPAASQPAKDPT